MNISLIIPEFQGSKIRATPKGKFSVIDCMTAVGLKSSRRVWKDLAKASPEVVTLTNGYKFSGRGQQETPVADLKTLAHIFMVIPIARLPEHVRLSLHKAKDRLLELAERVERGDITLAEEIVDRNNNPEDLKRLDARTKAKLSNKMLNSKIKQHGGKCYASVADRNNVAVTGYPARELKILRGIKQTRDGMDTGELQLLGLTEMLESSGLDKFDAQGDRQIMQVVCNVTEDIKKLKNKYLVSA